MLDVVAFDLFCGSCELATSNLSKLNEEKEIDKRKKFPRLEKFFIFHRRQ